MKTFISPIVCLRDLRTKKGLKQSDLANILGVQRELVSYWETGKRKPTEEQVSAVKVALDYYDDFVFVTPNELVEVDAPTEFDIHRFGFIVQHARRGCGFTAERFADELRVSRSTVAQWETGRHIPPLSTFMELCILLKKSASELLGLIPYEDNSMAYELLLAYAKLNKEGKEEAYKRVEELSEIGKYKKGDKGAEEI